MQVISTDLVAEHMVAPSLFDGLQVFFTDELVVDDEALATSECFGQLMVLN